MILVGLCESLAVLELPIVNSTDLHVDSALPLMTGATPDHYTTYAYMLVLLAYWITCGRPQPELHLEEVYATWCKLCHHNHNLAGCHAPTDYPVMLHFGLGAWPRGRRSGK